MKQLIKDIKGCRRCSLAEGATRKVIGRGSQTPRILFVGEAPGAKEDETGRPFCGNSGRLLNEWIEFLGLEKKEYAVINCIKCRPPQNVDPTREQLDSCREWLDKQIEILDPEVIFLVGRFAAKEVGGFTDGILSMAGKVIEKDGRKYAIMPHPSYYLRKGGTGWEIPLQDIEDYLSKEGQDIPMKTAFDELKPVENIPDTQPRLMVQPSRSGMSCALPDDLVSYVPLHFHTTYSVGDSCTKISDMVSYAKQLGIPALAITDHGTISGWWEFQSECFKEGVKPLLGVEFYVADDFETKDKKRYHVVAIAKDDVGVKNIYALNELAHSEGYYYKPRIRIRDLVEYSEGLVITSACVLGVISQKIIEGTDGEVEARLLQSVFGDDFYLEIQLHDFDDQKRANLAVIKLARKLGIKLVVTSDCHYLQKDAKRTHDALKAIMYNKKFGEAGFSIDSNYLIPSKEMFALATEYGIPSDLIVEAMKNTLEVAGKCDAKLERFTDAMPKFGGE